MLLPNFVMLSLGGWICCTALVWGNTPPAARLSSEKGQFRFEPARTEDRIPERYRLSPATYTFELHPKLDLPVSEVEVYHLQFPSPVKSPFESNNTVHAEYYRPKGNGPFPAVIVLDILGGDQSLARSMALFLAQNKIAGLFVQMAYYGPRRPTDQRVRLLMPDIQHTTEAIRQSVLDCRVATAWLASRKELSASKLGIVGTSMGSFVGALTAEMEPRLIRVALLLGGGGLVEAYSEHPIAKPYLQLLEKVGFNRQKLQRAIAPIDPITHAENLKDRKLLIIAAARDEVVPPKAAQQLWEASGKQRIIWYNTTHAGAAIYLVSVMHHLLEHFRFE